MVERNAAEIRFPCPEYRAVKAISVLVRDLLKPSKGTNQNASTLHSSHSSQYERDSALVHTVHTRVKDSRKAFIT